MVVRAVRPLDRSDGLGTLSGYVVWGAKGEYRKAVETFFLLCGRVNWML